MPRWAYGFHLFVGEPLPMGGEPRDEHGGVFEPYFRLGGLWGERTRFQIELGLLFKFNAVLED